MIYNPNISGNAQMAITKLEYLIEKGKVFELKEKRAKRSISQNSYMHLIFAWFASEYGELPSYVKQVLFKQIVNPHIFKTTYVNEKTGEEREDWRSTADMNTKELTTAIENFRNYSIKEAGIYLPEPDDLALIQTMEHQLENNRG